MQWGAFLVFEQNEKFVNVRDLIWRNGTCKLQRTSNNNNAATWGPFPHRVCVCVWVCVSVCAARLPQGKKKVHTKSTRREYLACPVCPAVPSPVCVFLPIWLSFSTAPLGFFFFCISQGVGIIIWIIRHLRHPFPSPSTFDFHLSTRHSRASNDENFVINK